MADRNLVSGLDVSSVQDLFELAIINTYDPFNPREVQYLDIEFLNGIVTLPCNELDMVCICIGSLQVFLIFHEGSYIMVAEIIGNLKKDISILPLLQEILINLTVISPKPNSPNLPLIKSVSKIVLKPHVMSGDSEWKELEIPIEN